MNPVIDAREGVVKRSIVIAGHRTSVSMEQPFWDQLKRIAEQDNSSIAALIGRIDGGRARQNLSSAIRVFVLAQALKQQSAGSASLP
jgi:predicted DNA-binding ribbon-helix-helix protein